MDWFTWLSKTGLDPSLVYEYGLSFAHNELEHKDIAYFNHEFLQSMGISIAKHRLEILKLARKEKLNIPRPVSRVLIAIKRTKKCFSRYLKGWIRREESGLAIVPVKNSMVKRNKKFVVNGCYKKKNGIRNGVREAPLLLTNGSSMYFPSSRINSFSSPLVDECEKEDEKMDQDCDDVDDDDYWSSAVEEIRWDTMFQNLKPT